MLSPRQGRSTIVLIVFAVALLGVVPAVASAEVFTVNSIGDGADLIPGNSVCAATPTGCTLRAAIEESNELPGADEIKFSPLFNGESLGAIKWLTTQPTITESVTIAGGRCETEAENEAGDPIEGPCVELDAGAGAHRGIDVAADDVTVEGLAIWDAAVGINAQAGSEHLTVKNTWVGVKLSGAPGIINFGILLGPGADEAIIGGPLPSERNVVAGTQSEALGIKGASDAEVQGNWFGLTPDGLATEEAANEIDIEATTFGGSEAVGNEIGTDVGPAAAATPACDGGCNVIANIADTSRNAIDLRGELGAGEGPPKGTAILGNFIGLGADGSAATGFFSAVEAARSIDTLVGGPDPGERNHITGGMYGIRGEESPGLVVEGNAIGMNYEETQVTLDPVDGIGITTGELMPEADWALVAGNRIASGDAGRGIEIQGAGASVIDNTIGLGAGGVRLGAGEYGIRAYEAPGGSRIEGDTIVGASRYGVLLESPENGVEASTILDSGEAGVLVQQYLEQPLLGSVVGGDVPELESEISGSGGPAIALIGPKVDQSYMFRNHGSGNAGPFIDINYNGPGTAPGQPNGGIEAPVIGSVTATGASGTSKPNALIRVFRKATAEIGEIESFLAGTEADAEGKWSVTYSALPPSTNIAANQTGDGDGTSEFDFAVTAPNAECVASGSSGCGGAPPVQCSALMTVCGAPGPDRTAPDTKIAKKPKLNGSPTAKFKFTSTISGSSFECKLDKGKFKKCRSPQTYKKLKPGKHVFKVRAVSPAGVADPSPATKKFTVKSS